MAIRRGFTEKAVKPLNHSEKSFLKVYPEAPSSRSLWSTDTLAMFLVARSTSPMI